MTDSYMLRNLIKEKGFKLKYIAQKMGITYYTLQRKINNEVTFNSEEILKLKEKNIFWDIHIYAVNSNISPELQKIIK